MRACARLRALSYPPLGSDPRRQACPGNLGPTKGRTGGPRASFSVGLRTLIWRAADAPRRGLFRPTRGRQEDLSALLTVGLRILIQGPYYRQRGFLRPTRGRSEGIQGCSSFLLTSPGFRTSSVGDSCVPRRGLSSC